MPESDTLPPGWVEVPGGWQRSFGRYRCRVYSCPVDCPERAYDVEVEMIPPPDFYRDAEAYSLEEACRRAEELACELAAWRPPALPHTEGEG